MKKDTPYFPAASRALAKVYSFDRAFDRIELISTIIYLKANRLIVDCLNSECYVSKQTRQKILDELLTVP